MAKIVRNLMIPLFLLGMGGNATAIVIHDTFDPGGTIAGPRNISLANTPYVAFGEVLGNDRDIGARFTTGATSYTLTSVELALSRVLSSPTFTGPGDVDVLLYQAGVNGLPAVQLGLTHVTGIGTIPGIVEVFFSGNIELAASSTFWVAISAAPPGGEPTGIGWHIGVGNSVSSIARIDNGPWDFNRVQSGGVLVGTPMAMQVNADAAVPLPGSLPLTVFAMFALAFALRRSPFRRHGIPIVSKG